MEKRKILIAEDEEEILNLISLHMNMAGYQVLSASDGQEALSIAQKEKPALVILDLMLPKMEGEEVCRILRVTPQTKDIPIIMLTARTEIKDRLKGFEVGADDYVTKPFSPRELVVRVKRVLARAENKPTRPKRYIKDGLEIDLEDFKVKSEGKEVKLSKRERAILKALLSRPDEPLTYEEILDMVWGKDTFVEYGNINVYVCHLRQKIEKDPKNPQIIKTIKKKGYKIEL
ncbi:response regulator transcription factor [bacterium]|nr:response regulator transcription factor [bacterium]